MSQNIYKDNKFDYNILYFRIKQEGMEGGGGVGCGELHNINSNFITKCLPTYEEIIPMTFNKILSCFYQRNCKKKKRKQLSRGCVWYPSVNIIDLSK